MSIVSLFQKKRERLERSATEFVEIDATLSEGATHNAAVTEHPVEEGANIADHVRLEPAKLSLTGVITNHAIVPTFVNLNWTKVEDTYSLLRQWLAQAALLVVKSSLDPVDNMVIKSLSVTRNGPEDANILPFSMELQKISVVAGQTSDAKAKAPKPKTKAAEPKKTKPKQPPQRKSLAKQAGEAVSAYLRR